MYSTAPNKGNIYLEDSGSLFMKSKYSSSSIIRLPPSAGLLPYIIFGIDDSGLFILETIILGTSYKYGLIFLALLHMQDVKVNDIVIKLVPQDKTIIIDGIKKTATMDGHNVFVLIEMAEFPCLEVGENEVEVSCELVVEWYEAY